MKKRMQLVAVVIALATGAAVEHEMERAFHRPASGPTSVALRVPEALPTGEHQESGLRQGPPLPPYVQVATNSAANAQAASSGNPVHALQPDGSVSVLRVPVALAQTEYSAPRSSAAVVVVAIGIGMLLTLVLPAVPQGQWRAIAAGALVLFSGVAIAPFSLHRPSSDLVDGPMIQAPAAPSWAYDCNTATVYTAVFVPQPASELTIRLETIRRDERDDGTGAERRPA